MKTKFEIQGEHIELIKLLKITGLCSTGGMAQIAAAEGRVTVDGQIERRKRCKLRRGQVVVFEGRVIEVA
jgi:ribosome-associated protein